MHNSASRSTARLLPVIAAFVLAVGVGCGNSPQRPAPLEDQPPAADNAPDQQQGSEPTPTPTDGGTGSDREPAGGPSSPPGPTWVPEKIPEGEEPPGKPVDVCALITKDDVKKAYGFTRANARPGPKPTTLPPTYTCGYQGFKGKSKTPIEFGAVVTPNVTEPDAKQAVELVTSGNGKPVADVGDLAVFVPLEEGSATQSDQLVAVAKTGSGLSRAIVDAPPGTGVTKMVPLMKKVLGSL